MRSGKRMVVLFSDNGESGSEREGIDKMKTFKSGFGEGPGHVSSFPASVTAKSKQELARVILGIAVFWLTMKVKLQAVYAATRPQPESSSNSESDDEDIIIDEE